MEKRKFARVRSWGQAFYQPTLEYYYDRYFSPRRHDGQKYEGRDRGIGRMSQINSFMDELNDTVLASALRYLTPRLEFHAILSIRPIL